MFTGIIGDVGEIVAVEDNGDRRFTIACGFDPDDITMGASISCAGVCLTVIETGRVPRGRGWFAAQVSRETLSLTTLEGWRPATRVNLERALRVGDELGGHIVSGHVDGKALIVSAHKEGGSMRMNFEAPDNLSHFIAAKGSVALDGTSLTVNEVEGRCFGINLIPHTLAVTTWGERQPGDEVNIEIDMLARYVARLNEAMRG